jgi:Tfp pilus assembly protein PilN
MREPDFLPDWYPVLRRRRRAVRWQMWITVAVFAALALWMTQSLQRTAQARQAVIALDAQIGQTSIELVKLHELMTLQDQLRQQSDVVEKLGPHVPAARLIEVLDEAMPHEISLLELSQTIEERSRPAPPADRGAAAPAPGLLRRLKLTVSGVAPTDVELATFLARLASLHNVEEVSLAYVRDRSQSGRIMREFAVTFSIDLSGEVNP